MKVYIKNIDGVVIPKKATEVSAGYDIIATSNPKIEGLSETESSWSSIQYVEYETNLYIAPAELNVHTLIFPRSSISKYNLMLANGLGLCDCDYRGQILLRFKYLWQPENIRIKDVAPGEFIISGEVDFNKIYKKGDKIGQLVFAQTIDVQFEVVDNLDDTNRGSGGFGSTDYLSNKPSLSEIYQKAGGVPIKPKYTEEIKKQMEL